MSGEAAGGSGGAVTGPERRAGGWAYAGSAVVVVLSVAMAVVAFKVAPNHLNEVGFAASNREPSPTMQRLHNLLGFGCLANAVLALTPWRVVAAFLLVPLFLLSGWFFFATW